MEVSSNQKLINFYSHLTIGSIIYGLIAAHLAIFGLKWSSCDNCSSSLMCYLSFHLFGAPICLFNLYVSWFGLRKYSTLTKGFYITLLDNAFTANLVYFAFECNLIYTKLIMTAPMWENIVLSSIAIILVSGCGLSVYVKQKLMQS
jgi:hypothetical protein